MFDDRKTNIAVLQAPSASADAGSRVSRRSGSSAYLRHRGQFQSSRGFTLVEILIVVVILGIIAAITIPQMSNASMQARENMLRDDLRFLRNQIVLYRAQHHDLSPGAIASGAPTAANFVAQMTSFTDDVGNASATMVGAFRFGPYLSRIPSNPLSDKNDVLLVTGAAFPAADNSTGWIFNPDMPEIVVNQSGVDIEGVPYSTY